MRNCCTTGVAGLWIVLGLFRCAPPPEQPKVVQPDSFTLRLVDEEQTKSINEKISISDLDLSRDGTLATIARRHGLQKQNRTLLVHWIMNRTSGEMEGSRLIVAGKPLLDCHSLASVRPIRMNPSRTGYEMNLNFNYTGTDLLHKMTEQHIDKHLALVSGNRVLMVPVIREAIPNGFVTITGDFSRPEAERIKTEIENCWEFPR